MSMWDDEAGYDRTDPKHPDWHGAMAGVWDNRDKTARAADLAVGESAYVCSPDESVGLGDE